MDRNVKSVGRINKTTAKEQNSACIGLEQMCYKISKRIIASKGYEISIVVKVAATAILQHRWH